MTDSGLEKLIHRLSCNLAEDKLVQDVTDNLRAKLQVDRVVLYYFYRQWSGRVTFESLRSIKYSILGSTGPDECFNQEYAALYQEGRVNAIADIETAAIAECHRDFLRQLQVKANLVVPVLIPTGLWGLLIAHHCQHTVVWTEAEIKAMRTGAATLEKSQVIRDET